MSGRKLHTLANPALFTITLSLESITLRTAVVCFSKQAQDPYSQPPPPPRSHLCHHGHHVCVAPVDVPQQLRELKLIRCLLDGRVRSQLLERLHIPVTHLSGGNRKHASGIEARCQVSSRAAEGYIACLPTAHVAAVCTRWRYLTQVQGTIKISNPSFAQPDQ